MSETCGPAPSKPEGTEDAAPPRSLPPFPIVKIAKLSVRVWLVGFVLPGAAAAILAWVVMGGQKPGSIRIAFPATPTQTARSSQEPVLKSSAALADLQPDRTFYDEKLGLSIALPSSEGWTIRRGVTPEVLVKSIYGPPGGRAIFLYNLPLPTSRELWSMELSDIAKHFGFPGSMQEVRVETVGFRRVAVGGQQGLRVETKVGDEQSTSYLVAWKGRLLKLVCAMREDEKLLEASVHSMQLK